MKVLDRKRPVCPCVQKISFFRISLLSVLPMVILLSDTYREDGCLTAAPVQRDFAIWVDWLTTFGIVASAGDVEIIG
jgi:hypothetical protein